MKEISKLERIKHDKYNVLASLSQGARFSEMDHVRHTNDMGYKNKPIKDGGSTAGLSPLSI